MCLEAFSILRNFDEDRFLAMVGAYDAGQKMAVTKRDATELRNRLLNHGLARWDDISGSWMLDECLRSALEDLLKSKNRAAWQSLQSAALKLYNNWVECYPATAEIWRKEAIYHAQVLKQAAGLAICAAGA
jgi:hypothetical protein